MRYLTLLLFIVCASSKCYDDCSGHGDCIWKPDRGSAGHPSSNSSSYDDMFACDCDFGYKGIVCNESAIIDGDGKEKQIEEDIKEEIEEEKSLEGALLVSVIMAYTFGIIGLCITIYELVIYVKRKRQKAREENLETVSGVRENAVYRNINNL